MLSVARSKQVRRPPAPLDLHIDRSLALGVRLLRSVESYARSLGVDGFDVDLPPIAGSAVDQSHLRTVPPLYLASELEDAGLLPSVELLAGLVVGGSLAVDLGPAAEQILTFWRTRNERFSRDERRAFFARLFGSSSGPALAIAGSRNNEFDNCMIDLTEALYKLNPEPAIEALLHQGIAPASQISLQIAAESLIQNLLPRAGGMAGYAGRDLMASIQQALDILKQPAVQQAVGAHTVWGAVANIQESYQREAPDIDSHVRRGKAGMLVLAWIADAAPVLDDPSTFRVGSHDDIVGAATAWLEASLTLSEREAAVTTAPPRSQ